MHLVKADSFLTGSSSACGGGGVKRSWALLGLLSRDCRSGDVDVKAFSTGIHVFFPREVFFQVVGLGAFL